MKTSIEALDIKEINNQLDELLEAAIRSGLSFPQWKGGMKQEWLLILNDTLRDYKIYHQNRLENMSHGLSYRILKEV